jgi:hypothetical protein
MQDETKEILESYKAVAESLSYRVIGSQVPTDTAIVPFDPAVPLQNLLNLHLQEADPVARQVNHPLDRSIPVVHRRPTHTYIQLIKHHDSRKARAAPSIT